MAQKYVVSRSVLEQYYNIVGVDFRDIDFKNVAEEERYLERFSPQNYVNQSSSKCKICTLKIIFAL